MHIGKGLQENICSRKTKLKNDVYCRNFYLNQSENKKISVKMGLKQIDHGTPEYKQMIALRHMILRQPLGLNFSDEELEKEKNDILIAAFDDDDMLGCCMLTAIDGQTIRIRQMAVQNNVQRKGIGASIMSFIENIARDKGCKCLMMHARDTAVGFYEKFGYKKRGDEFIEVGIPHHVMEKKLH